MNEPMNAGITIQINGPGKLVSWPAALVVEALKKQGFNVILKSNEHSPKAVEVPTEPAALSWSSGSTGDSLTVIENHMPWGG